MKFITSRPKTADSDCVILICQQKNVLVGLLFYLPSTGMTPFAGRGRTLRFGYSKASAAEHSTSFLAFQDVAGKFALPKKMIALQKLCITKICPAAKSLDWHKIILPTKPSTSISFSRITASLKCHRIRRHSVI